MYRCHHIAVLTKLIYYSFLKHYLSNFRVAFTPRCKTAEQPTNSGGRVEFVHWGLSQLLYRPSSLHVL